MSGDVSFNPNTGPVYINPTDGTEETPPPAITGPQDGQTSAGGKVTYVKVSESDNPGVGDSTAPRDVPPSDVQAATSNRFFAGNAAVSFAMAMQEFIRTQKDIGMSSTDASVLGLQSTVALGENAAQESLAAGDAAANKEITQGFLAGFSAGMALGTGAMTIRSISNNEKNLSNQIKAGEEARDAAKTDATKAKSALDDNAAELNANQKLLNETSPPQTTSGTASVTQEDDALATDTFIASNPSAAAKTETPEMTVSADNPMEQRYVSGSATGRERSETVYTPLPSTLDPTPSPAATPAASTTPAAASTTPSTTAAQPAPNTPQYDSAKAAYEDDLAKLGPDQALANLTKRTDTLQSNQTQLQASSDAAQTQATKATADVDEMIGRRNLTLGQMIAGDPLKLYADIIKGVSEPGAQSVSSGVSSIFTREQSVHEANATESQTYKAAQQTGLEASQEQRKNASSAVDSTIQGWNKAVEDQQVRFQG